MDRLLDILRTQLKLTGTKEGCGEGECGACSVTLDGKLVNSCLVPIEQARGSEIVTIEGIGQSRPHAIQEAFLACGATQCGICTPGMVVAAHALLKTKKRPAPKTIRRWLAGNLCRCTGYQQIVEAVRHAGKRGAKP